MVKQGYCNWCHRPVYAKSVYNLKTFWNRQLEGYPICKKCLGSFKAGKQTTNNQDRERLGLKPEVKVKKVDLDKWLKVP